MTVQLLRNSLERQKGQRSNIENNLSTLRNELEINTQSLHKHEQAREIIRTVGMSTQSQLSFHISDIVSMALEAVFPEPYELKVEFVQRRNKTECDLKFVRDGLEIDPLSASGGGAIDVATFALRIASWSMMRPHTRNTIILDEPFKHLKGKMANLKVLEMIKEVSDKIGIQIIMISDERIPKEDIIASADKVFEISINKGISKVEEI